MTKEFKDLTPDEAKELEIVFVPGCFDHFDGTQEELDELMEQIKEMFTSGEALTKAIPLSEDDLSEEEIAMIEAAGRRTLQ